MRVFITEDSPVIRDRLREMLDSIPFVELAGEADNEARAVRSICELQPDVVILGFSSARENLNVLLQIRMKLLPVRVIITTNRVHSLYRKKCMDSGADHFLDKSRDIDVLIELLSSLADEAEPETGLAASG